MFSVRGLVCVMMCAVLVGCSIVDQNGRVDFKKVWDEGVASFDEPLSALSKADDGEDKKEVRKQPTTASAGSVGRSVSVERAVEPENAAIWKALIESAEAAERNFDYELATMHYSRLVELNPNDIGSVLGLASNLRYSGKPKEAILLLKSVMPTFPGRPKLSIELSKAQIAAGLLIEAERNVDSLLKEVPGEWEPHALKGVLLDHAEKYRAAQVAYGRALSLSPNNIAVLNNMSLSLAQEGQLGAAIRLLEDLVRSEYSTAQLRQNLALFYALNGDLQSAGELAQQDLPPEVVKENWSSFHLLQE